MNSVMVMVPSKCKQGRVASVACKKSPIFQIRFIVVGWSTKVLAIAMGLPIKVLVIVVGWPSKVLAIVLGCQKKVLAVVVG